MSEVDDLRQEIEVLRAKLIVHEAEQVSSARVYLELMGTRLTEGLGDIRVYAAVHASRGLLGKITRNLSSAKSEASRYNKHHAKRVIEFRLVPAETYEKNEKDKWPKLTKPKKAKK